MRLTERFTASGDTLHDVLCSAVVRDERSERKRTGEGLSNADYFTIFGTCAASGGRARHAGLDGDTRRWTGFNGLQGTAAARDGTRGSERRVRVIHNGKLGSTDP